MEDHARYSTCPHSAHLGIIPVLGRGLAILCAMLAVPAAFGGEESNVELPPLRIAQDHSWPPFAFEDESGQPAGLLIDLWTYYGELMEREVVFDLVDWPDTLRIVEEGRADVHGGLFASTERDKRLDFTDEFVPLQTYLFGEPELAISELDEVGERVVGVVAGSYELEFVLTAQPELNVREYRNNETMIQAALDGELRLFVADYPVALYLLDELGGKTRFHPKAQLYARHLVSAVAEGNAPLQRELNRVLASADADEVRRIQQRWIRSDTVQVVPGWVYPSAVGGGLIVVLIGYCLLLFNQRRQLGALVRERTQALEMSEARYRNFFELATNPLFILQDGKFTDCNQAAADLFGCERSDLVGSGPGAISPPEQADGTSSEASAEQWIQHAIQHGVARFDWLHQRSDGKPVWFDISLTRIYDSPSPVILGSLHEITDRIEMEAELRRSDRRYARLARQSGTFVWEVDPEGRFTYVSASVEPVLGYRPDELVGQRFIYDLCAGDERERVQAITLEMIGEQRTLDHFEYEVLTRSGDKKWLLGSGLVLRDEADQVVVGYQGSSTDITNRKQLEEDMQDAQMRAETANAAKSEFLANMSHEVRTPMNGVIGMNDMLLQTQLSEEQREYAETMRDSSLGLLHLLNDILDLSKIEAGKLHLEERPFDLVPLVESTLKPLAFVPVKEGVELRRVLDPDLPECVVGDATRLAQVLQNLISNALKFTRQGFVELRATVIELNDSQVRLRFEVEDTGIGIASERVPHLFQKFSQAESSTATEFGGSGLGLAICRELVEAMRGQIDVHSVSGEGSTFWVEIPFQLTERSAEPQAASGRAGAERPAKTTSKILVVEDNAVNRKVAMLHLKRLGYPAEAVESGEAALERLQKSPYDLVFMDVRMPGMGGLAATRAIRQWESDAQRERTPIVALTAHAMEGDRENCLDSGMDDYLTKPIRSEVLAGALAKWIRRL